MCVLSDYLNLEPTCAFFNLIIDCFYNLLICVKVRLIYIKSDQCRNMSSCMINEQLLKLHIFYSLTGYANIVKLHYRVYTWLSLLVYS